MFTNVEIASKVLFWHGRKLNLSNKTSLWVRVLALLELDANGEQSTSDGKDYILPGRYVQIPHIVCELIKKPRQGSIYTIYRKLWRESLFAIRAVELFLNNIR